jgi:putative membrane protein
MIKEITEVFKNDIKTIKNNPTLIILLIVIICLPSLYVLFNVEAAWDPYGKTSHIEVAVVDGDSGYIINGSHYNVGNTLVDELKNNTNFSWQFVDKETALNGVKNETYYAALIVPDDFSKQLLSIETTTPQQAQIEYIDNEKLNPVAPRLTGTGAEEIQTKINNEIVKTIGGIIFGKLSDVGELAKENKADFLKTKSFINQLNNNLGNIDTSIAEANSDMAIVNQVWPKISAELPEAQKESNTVRKEYDALYAQITANPQQALATVRSMESNTNNILTSLKTTDAALTALYNTTGDPQLKPVIAQIEDNITKVNKVMGALQELESSIKDSDNPQGKLAALKNSIDEMDNGINLLANNKDNINQKIQEASSKLALANNKWPTIKSAVQAATLKLNSINEGDINKLIAFSDVNQSGVQNYFQSPVALNKESMYPINNYGSALAPFYIALSLWIGCLIAVAMVAVRVRSNKKISARTAYFGRINLFFIISILQALLIASSALYLNVQTSSAILLTLTTLVIGLCFMIIMYSLILLLGSLGKAVAIVTLILQVAASGGVYPVQLQSHFFQVVNPYLPMTYAIGALREVIGGVLWNNYWYNLGIVFVFTCAILVLTLLVKRGEQKMSDGEEKLKKTGLV